jgi:hypothetical protein
VGGVAGGDGVSGSGDASVFIWATALLIIAAYSAFKEAMSMEKRYLTSDLTIRS